MLRRDTLRCKARGGWGGSAHCPDPTAQSASACAPRRTDRHATPQDARLPPARGASRTANGLRPAHGVSRLARRHRDGGAVALTGCLAWPGRFAPTPSSPPLRAPSRLPLGRPRPTRASPSPSTLAALGARHLLRKLAVSRPEPNPRGLRPTAKVHSPPRSYGPTCPGAASGPSQVGDGIALPDPGPAPPPRMGPPRSDPSCDDPHVGCPDDEAPGSARLIVRPTSLTPALGRARTCALTRSPSGRGHPQGGPGGAGAGSRGAPPGGAPGGPGAARAPARPGGPPGGPPGGGVWGGQTPNPVSCRPRPCHAHVGALRALIGTPRG